MNEDNHEASYEEVLNKYEALTPRQKKALERLALRNIEQRKAMLELEKKRAKALKDKTIWTKEFKLFGDSYFGPWELIRGLAIYAIGIMAIALMGHGLLQSASHWFQS